MRRRILYLFLLLISCFPILHGQNAIVGDGFSTGWGVGSCPSTGNDDFKYFSEMLSSTYGLITQPFGNTSGDKYWRYGVDWGATTLQMTITEGSNVTVSPGTKYSLNTECTTDGALKYTVPSGGGSWNYVFKTLNAGSSPTGTVVFFEVQGDVRTITSHSSPASSSVYPGLSQRLTVTMSGLLNSGQSAYIRYHTGAGFSSATITELTYSGSGTDYYADIPASANRYGTTVTYYFFTSGSGLTISNDDADLFTINYLNNGGSNYSYAVNGTWKAESDGDWSLASTWNVNTMPPSSENMGPVVINTNVTLDQNATVSSLTINSLKTFTASGSSPVTLTVDASASATTLNNNGTWDQGTGGNTVIFSAGADMTHTVSGEVPFHHVTISRSSGTPAVGVDFGSSSTVSGTLKLTVGSFVNTNAPSFEENSYLQYSIGGDYNRNVEWSQNSGNGYPYHVRISDNTHLHAFNGTESPRQIAGNLIIDAGSTFDMDNMDLGESYDVGIIIGGDTLLNKGTVTLSTSVERLQCGTYLGEAGSTLTLSSEYGGDLEIMGDYTNYGSFTSNSRALFFTGSAGDQTITFSDGQQFDYMIVDKSAGNVVLSQDIQINKKLTLTKGLITSKTGNSYSVIMGDNPDTPPIENEAVSYIDGKLRQTFTSAQSLQYPVGRGGAYRPVSFEYTSLSSNSYVMVEHVNAVQPGSIPESIRLLENRHWEVTQSGGSSLEYKITLDPNVSDALGNIVMVKYEDDDNTWHPTTSPDYTNLPPFTTLAGTNSFALAEDCTIEVQGDNDTTCYPTLQSAFQAINNGLHTGNIKVLVHGSTTETSTARLNASGTGSASYSQVTLYPTLTGLSISGNLDGPLIDLDGADNVTIDGRVNATGTEKDLTIVNSSTDSTASTIRFVNSACENKVQYCTLQGSTTKANGGIVFFDGARSTDPEGNNRNVICNNNITNANGARPLNAVYSNGTDWDLMNVGDTIRDNFIYDFLAISGANSGGVTIGENNSNWAITGNSFFEIPDLEPIADVDYHAVSIVTNAGSNFNITDNYIGGKGANCSNGFWVKSGSADNQFIGINMSIYGTGTIRRNKIAKIQWTNSGKADWSGILIQDGEITIGGDKMEDGNTIGDTISNGSIQFTSSLTGASLFGINRFRNFNYNDVTIKNNIIGSLTASNSNDNYSTNLYAIFTGPFLGTADIIRRNTIGSFTTPNSLQSISPVSGTTDDANQKVCGIANFAVEDSQVIIDSNQISNLFNGAIGVNLSGIYGIYSENGDVEISTNIIQNLNSSSPGKSTTSIAGINIINPQITWIETKIINNKILNLNNSNASEPVNVSGLVYQSFGTGIIEKNFIYNLSAISSNPNATVYGLNILDGITVYRNNIIAIGLESNNASFTGIRAVSGQSEIYYNTVCLKGNGSGSDDFAIQVVTPTTIPSSYGFNIRNNIFANFRSGLHSAYAAKIDYDIKDYHYLNFNDYHGDTANIGQNTNSLFIDPLFTNLSGENPIDFKPLADSLQAEIIPEIPRDYFDSLRCFPTMGAIEVPNIPDPPSPITGKTEVCPNESGLVYSCPEVPYATSYTWSVPAGWSITGGQGDTSITVTAGATGANGSINVVASNHCGDSPAASHEVTVVALPATSLIYHD